MSRRRNSSCKDRNSEDVRQGELYGRFAPGVEPVCRSGARQVLSVGCWVLNDCRFGPYIFEGCIRGITDSDYLNCDSCDFNDMDDTVRGCSLHWDPEHTQKLEAVPTF